MVTLTFNSFILGAFGPTEIIFVLVVLLLFFGGRKIPELMRGLGQGIKEFKDASKGEDKKTTSSTEITPEDK
jgi:sec-independent protein translocase protein TatA